MDLAKVKKPEEIRDLRDRVLRTAMPFGFESDDGPISHLNIADAEHPRKERLEVAFIKFEIDGSEAKDINTLRTHLAYDIGMDIRVSRWPQNAEQLVLTPITMEPADTYDLPTFRIERPMEVDGGGPFAFVQSGRLRLKVAAALGAHPFEFKYRAVFEPAESEQPLTILGHRSLRLESVDNLIGPVSGYTEVDEKLLSIRNELRTIPGLPDGDLANALQVCGCLGNLAGQALSDSLFAEGTNEEAFQREAVKQLRRWPSIGEELERHPQTGGGICDLSFRRIRIELKAIPQGEISDSDLEKFSDQTAQYVVSSGKRLGILCILDSRKKIAPPEPPESHIRVLVKHVGNASVAIIHLRVEGGLARPSDLSR